MNSLISETEEKFDKNFSIDSAHRSGLLYSIKWNYKASSLCGAIHYCQL